MYIISKILPLFFLPLGLSLVLILSRRVYHSKWPILSAFTILWLFSLGIVKDGLWRQVEAPWKLVPVSSIGTADAIVVLSGGEIRLTGEPMRIDWYDPDRFLAGVELFKEGKAPLLLFTGEKNTGNLSTGQLYIQEAYKRGIPYKNMATTSIVRNTYDEAIAIKSLIGNSNYKKHKRVILITSGFHMHRAKKIFERQGFEITPYPVNFNRKDRRIGSIWQEPEQWIPKASNLSESSRAIRELIGRFYYRIW